MKKVLLASVVILGLGVYFALSQMSPFVEQSLHLSSPQKSDSRLSHSSGTAAPAPSPTQTEGSSASLSPQFQNWFTSESDSVESSTPNSQQKEQELRDLVARMTPTELSFLAKKAVDMSGPARARIFAMYLLTLETGLTQNQLLQVATTPLSINPQAPAHSPEETLGAQERTLRRMALDALFDRARQHPEFRPELFAALQQIKNESLKKYAEKRKHELP